MFATLGTYSVSNSIFDVGVMYLIGLVGFAMRKFDFPIAPAIIGLILGPMAEQQFRRALAISAGDPSVFLTRPLSATLLGIAALVLLGPTAWERIRRRRQTHAVPTPRP
jgi:putative tricarboxylic transport membrane protein